MITLIKTGKAELRVDETGEQKRTLSFIYIYIYIYKSRSWTTGSKKVLAFVFSAVGYFFLLNRRVGDRLRAERTARIVLRG